MLSSCTMKETGNRRLKELIRLYVSRETSSCIQMPWRRRTRHRIVSYENKKINYIVLDRKDNYAVNERTDFKNLNTYQKHFNLSKTPRE